MERYSHASVRPPPGRKKHLMGKKPHRELTSIGALDQAQALSFCIATLVVLHPSAFVMAETGQVSFVYMLYNFQNLVPKILFDSLRSSCKH